MQTQARDNREGQNFSPVGRLTGCALVLVVITLCRAAKINYKLRSARAWKSGEVEDSKKKNIIAHEKLFASAYARARIRNTVALSALRCIYGDGEG